MKIFGTNELDLVEMGSERVKLVAEKLAALQKEVDKEMKIRDGLEKMLKAKAVAAKLTKKKFNPDNEFAFQLEKSNKKLELLKHEMQKRSIQLQSLQVQHDSVTDVSEIDSQEQDTGLLRVTVQDPVTHTQVKKVIFIEANQSTLEVIEKVLNKLTIGGIPSEFELHYVDHEASISFNVEAITLKNEDRPMQIENINYAETWFHLTKCVDLRPKISIKKEDTLYTKQQEILAEIFESEDRYLNDLKLIITVLWIHIGLCVSV